jgi:hypothetical protein
MEPSFCSQPNDSQNWAEGPNFCLPSIGTHAPNVIIFLVDHCAVAVHWSRFQPASGSKIARFD